MKAINNKHQKTVDKAVKWLKKYNETAEAIDKADGEGDIKKLSKLEGLGYKQYDMFLTYMGELPKREREQIYNSNLY